jgi:hypothetical protein
MEDKNRSATPFEIKIAGLNAIVLEKFGKYFERNLRILRFKVVYVEGVPSIPYEANILLLLFSWIRNIPGTADDSKLASLMEPIYYKIFSLYNVQESHYMAASFRRNCFQFTDFIYDFFSHSLSVCKEFGSYQFYLAADKISKIENEDSEEFENEKKSFLERFRVPALIFDTAIDIPFNIERYCKERKIKFGTSGPFLDFIAKFETEYNIFPHNILLRILKKGSNLPNEIILLILEY